MKIAKNFAWMLVLGALAVGLAGCGSPGNPGCNGLIRPCKLI